MRPDSHLHTQIQWYGQAKVLQASDALSNFFYLGVLCEKLVQPFGELNFSFRVDLLDLLLHHFGLLVASLVFLALKKLVNHG